MLCFIPALFLYVLQVHPYLQLFLHKIFYPYIFYGVYSDLNVNYVFVQVIPSIVINCCSHLQLVQKYIIAKEEEEEHPTNLVQ